MDDGDRLSCQYSADGLHIRQEGQLRPEPRHWLGKPEIFGNQSELVSYLSQLEEEGFAKCAGDKVQLLWENLYRLLELPEHLPSLALFNLPSTELISPCLKSSGGLSDSHFSITISGWRFKDGRPISQEIDVHGATVDYDGRQALLPRDSWSLVQAVKTFAAVPTAEKTPNQNRYHWAKIRQLALAAGAGLDHFLAHTIVLTPQKLLLDLRKAKESGTTVVEIIPRFEGAPEGWIETFDGYRQVQDRYDIPLQAGLVHVIIEPRVRTVLSEIKRMPGRRVAGQRAEAFVRNPFALLGEDAGQVISEEEFAEAREDAGIYLSRFTAQVVKDDIGLCGASLLIESSQKGTIVSETYTFQNPDDLKTFVREFEEKLSRGMQCCAWKGWDLELLGDAEQQLGTLRDALAEWLRPRPLIRYSGVFDLSRYSGRIEAVGQEKPYYSPFIAKQRDDEGWIPDNAIAGIWWKREGSTEAEGVPLDAKQLEELQDKIAATKSQGRSELLIGNNPNPIKVEEAENLIEVLKQALEDVQKGKFPKPTKADHKSEGPSKPISLVVKPNIQRVDYFEKRRRAALAVYPERRPKLPRSLKATVKLLDHQRKGIAWLQQLWSISPDSCRGIILADDMGLGKTLQILTFAATCFEDDPNLKPALMVAPVSLLENWNIEIKKFFEREAFTVLTLYGSELADKKLRRHEIEKELLKEGLTRFLKPNWIGDANIVLTTYETLRDLEFSLAPEPWSIMICDEAQKIKNPNALVTRAAKKQDVRFKIACTGTPVENSLADLWSLYDFVQPGLLGALNEFGVRYRQPIEAKTDEERARVEELRNMIAPQLIRRTKREAAQDLPKKLIVDSCRNIQMSSHQKALYAHAVSAFRSRSSETGKNQHTNHLTLLQSLKRICADPRPLGQLAQVTDSLEDYKKRSPKMRWLMKELQTICSLNEKAIIYTEYRDIQRLIQSYVREAFSITADIINGDTVATSESTTSRQKRIDAFQAKRGFNVIILSPLAAGVGLNIQGANHVIHYTRTWNPAKEDQATDRAYRIGQKKDVFVYCPIITDATFKTFESRLDELLEWKRSISHDILNGHGDLASPDFGELEGIDGAPVMPDQLITIEDVMCMDSDTFEVFCAVLWQKKGYPVTYRTKRSGDKGVDVVALKGTAGSLLQAKSSLKEGKELGWEAVKDVVGGTAAYSAKHHGVTFIKYSVTNQFFNTDAQDQAHLNDVELVDQPKLKDLLSLYPVKQLEIERYILSQ